MGSVVMECETAIAVSASRTDLKPWCTFLADHVDAYGNLLPQWPSTRDTPPALLGVTRAVSKHGKLTFTDLRVERSGGEYRLRFARVAGGLVEAVTSNFNVATGAAWRLFLKRQPGVSSITGWVLEPQPAVLLLDKGGNVVTDPSQQRRIHVTLLQHGYPVWDHNCEAGEQAYCRPAEHMSAASATSSAGVASFEGLQLHRVGSGYTMVFCDGPCRSRAAVYQRTPAATLPSAQSQLQSAPDVLASAPTAAGSGLRAPVPLRWVESWPPLSVKAGSAYKAVIWRALGGCIARLPCVEQPVVLIQDRGGNTITDLQPTDVAVSIFEDEATASSSPYTLSGTGTTVASAKEESDVLRDLVATTVRGRADFSDVQVNLATPRGANLSIAYAASIYNLAIQTSLTVSEVPAKLSWERQAPLTSAAGLTWPPYQQPVLIICDSSGVRVEADSKSVVEVELVASQETLAAGNALGKGARNAASLVLGNKRAKCCRGRCAFTDLSIGLAGSGMKLRASTFFERLHVGRAPLSCSPLPTF